MKKLNLLLIILSLCSFNAFTQDKKESFDSAALAIKIEESKLFLEKKLGKEEVSKMTPILIIKELSLNPDKKFVSDSDCGVDPTGNTTKSIDEQIASHTKLLKSIGPDESKGVLFIQWGYNRGFHSDSDITIKTPQGEIIIRDARGKDRPSPFSLEYLKLSKFSIPQYNLKLGYWFSKKSNWGIGLGTDHMKWVFDPTAEYEIEGDYTGDLWIGNEKKSFSEIEQGTNAGFLLLEHTDGYNYPYIEVLHKRELLSTKRFQIDAVAGLGAGILFPKTRTRIRNQEDSGNYSDVDNEFHVAGWGAHVDISAALKYKQKNGISYFLKPTVRGVAGKINNALYLGNADGTSISQSMIYTLEPSLNIGVEVPLTVISNPAKRKVRRELRELKRIKRENEINDNKELTLQELQNKLDSEKEVKS
jgi:hypothetical protein